MCDIWTCSIIIIPDRIQWHTVKYKRPEVDSGSMDLGKPHLWFPMHEAKIAAAPTRKGPPSTY